MSGKMAAIVGYILDERFSEPAISELVVTSDGFVLAQTEGEVGANEMLGSEVDLNRNLLDLIAAAGLAGRRLAKTRDVLTWQRDMAQLDAEEQAARQPAENGRLAPREVVGYLRSLPALWADTGPDGRQAMATTLFARTEVLGFEQMIYELTPDAIELGLDAALPAVFELSCTIAEFGRGERDSPATNDLPITMRLAEPPEPCELVRSA